MSTVLINSNSEYSNKTILAEFNLKIISNRLIVHFTITSLSFPPDIINFVLEAMFSIEPLLLKTYNYLCYWCMPNKINV